MEMEIIVYPFWQVSWEKGKTYSFAMSWLVFPIKTKGIRGSLVSPILAVTKVTIDTENRDSGPIGFPIILAVLDLRDCEPMAQ